MTPNTPPVTREQCIEWLKDAAQHFSGTPTGSMYAAILALLRNEPTEQVDSTQGEKP